MVSLNRSRLASPLLHPARRNSSTLSAESGRSSSHRDNVLFETLTCSAIALYPNLCVSRNSIASSRCTDFITIIIQDNPITYIPYIGSLVDKKSQVRPLPLAPSIKSQAPELLPEPLVPERCSILDRSMSAVLSRSFRLVLERASDTALFVRASPAAPPPVFASKFAPHTFR